MFSDIYDSESWGNQLLTFQYPAMNTDLIKLMEYVENYNKIKKRLARKRSKKINAKK